MAWLLYCLIHLLTQFIFLVVLMQIAGRFLQIDFGPLRPALLKALIVAALFAAVWIFVTPHLNWAGDAVVVVVLSILCLTLIIRLDAMERWLFIPLLAVGSWLVFILATMALLDILRALQS